MATPRKAESESSPGTSPKRLRTGYNLNVWISDEHGAVFEELLRRSRRTKTAEIEVMLERLAAEAGLWPPPAPAAETDPKKKGKGGK